jgi:sugar lactone lactonase YvrE
MPEAVQLTRPFASHGEGPLWDATRKRLLCVDMLVGDVVEVSDTGDIARHPVGSIAAVIRARASGGYLLGVENGFAFSNDEFTELERLPALFDDASLRLNDGGCDPQGRFFCGSMAYAETPGAGSVYRLDPDLSVHIALTDVTISNGLQWSPDGLTAYYNDTPTGRVDAFDYDGATGTFSDRRAFVSVTGTPGLPDGMAIDVEGGIWVALWGGSAVRRYDSSGALSEVVEVGASQVTSCAFGGEDLRTLFITTSQVGVDYRSDDEGAGAIFALDVPVSGAVPYSFAG